MNKNENANTEVSGSKPLAFGRVKRSKTFSFFSFFPLLFLLLFLFVACVELGGRRCECGLGRETDGKECGAEDVDKTDDLPSSRRFI